MTNRSLAASNRTSPGIMSPADSLTMSPGTSCWRGISRCWPSRTTVAVTLIMALSLAAALLARVSCTNRRATPSTTMSSMTVPARKSPVAKDNTARMVRRITSGLRTAIHRRSVQPCFFSRPTSLGPYWASRAPASSSLSPAAEVFKTCRTSAISFVAAPCVTSGTLGSVAFEFPGIRLRRFALPVWPSPGRPSIGICRDRACSQAVRRLD